MKTSIVSTGEEILYGRTADGNAAFLARELGLRGFQLQRLVAIGDSPAALEEELLRCAQDSSVIVMSGGLGPTADDRTRGAVARAAGAELVSDEDSRRHVTQRLRSFGRAASPAQLTQALFPAGSVIFPNPWGTARGFACRIGDAWLTAMPGVPGEMRPMFAESVLPFLMDKSTPVGHVAVETVHLFPISESEADERIADMSDEARNPYLGITVAGSVITLSIRACGATPQEAEALMQADLAVLKNRFGDLVFGFGDVTLAGGLAAALEAGGCTVAVAESVTGGLIDNMLVDVPGISRFFKGGVVAYGDEAKADLLGVPRAEIEAHGAVSPQVAESMARGVCRALGARLGISTTGLAGPSGGSAEKPVGLVYVGVCLDGRTAVRRLNMRGDRWQIKDRAAKHALNLGRLALLRGLDALPA